jgi:hypothetical protein
LVFIDALKKEAFKAQCIREAFENILFFLTGAHPRDKVLGLGLDA